MKLHRLLLRFGAAALLFLGLAGTSPGNVGGCSDEFGRAPPVESCVEIEEAICFHELIGGRADVFETETCRIMANTETCVGFSWPFGCSPFIDDVDDCVNLLLTDDDALLAIPGRDLRDMHPRCDLCP
ncbi:MAG: hypothetical protein ACFCGT_10090 [Sandaracinaceae bacterium]